MNSKEMLFFVDAIANEKGLDRAEVFEALECALAAAVRRLQKEEMDVRVEIDNNTGEHEAFRCWTVVEDDAEEFDAATMIFHRDAVKEDGSAVVGDVLEEHLKTPHIGRIGVQIARQVIMQKLREASRRKLAQEYEPRIGEIFLGTVRRIDRGRVFVGIAEGIEGVMYREHQLPEERYRIGSRLRVLLYEISADTRDTQLLFSRTDNRFLAELFRMEIPEIADGIIDIKAVARDPGQRAKVAVSTGDPHLDVIGACVGMRGARVQAVMGELNGERVDVIQWNPNPAEFVINAMSPSEILSVTVDEQERSMDIAVSSEMLSQAIGRSGQNVRLASELTGWELNAMTLSDLEEKEGERNDNIVQHFTEQLNIGEKTARTLIQAGLLSLEEIAYLGENELNRVEGLSAEKLGAIRNAANDALLMAMLEQ